MDCDLLGTTADGAMLGGRPRRRGGRWVGVSSPCVFSTTPDLELLGAGEPSPSVSGLSARSGRGGLFCRD